MLAGVVLDCGGGGVVLNGGGGWVVLDGGNCVSLVVEMVVVAATRNS